MAKYPRYSVVIQNVRPDCKQTVLHHVSGAKRSAVAVEPYNHQPGHHIHIFIEYQNQHHFTSVLKEYKDLATKIVAHRPEGIEGDWGRVDVDRMRGTFEQATQYLVAPTKDKAVDPDVVVSQAPFQCPHQTPNPKYFCIKCCNNFTTESIWQYAMWFHKFKYDSSRPWDVEHWKELNNLYLERCLEI